MAQSYPIACGSESASVFAVEFGQDLDEPGARLTLHQDRNEQDYTFPIVSVSLGLPAIFQFGGLNRADPIRKYALHHGDVAIWGGPSRLCHHGLLALKDGEHPKLRRTRLNLTFRRAL